MRPSLGAINIDRNEIACVFPYPLKYLQLEPLVHTKIGHTILKNNKIIYIFLQQKTNEDDTVNYFQFCGSDQALHLKIKYFLYKNGWIEHALNILLIGILHGVEFFPKPSVNLQWVWGTDGLIYQKAQPFHPSLAFFIRLSCKAIQ